MLTNTERELLNKRDSLSEDEQALIDITFEAMYNYAIGWNIKVAGDDRAASLEAALIKFIIESKGK